MARVLIIDDDELILKTHRALLEDSGIEVLTASDAIHADTILDTMTGSIDLILLDVGLPLCPGDEIAKIYHTERRPTHPTMKIVLYSGMDERELNERSIRSNADGYIVKGAPDLIGSVKRYLGRNGKS